MDFSESSFIQFTEHNAESNPLQTFLAIPQSHVHICGRMKKNQFSRLSRLSRARKAVNVVSVKPGNRLTPEKMKNVAQFIVKFSGLSANGRVGH